MPKETTKSEPPGGVLATTDASNHALAAVDYAARLAARLGADLTLLKTRHLKSRADIMVNRIEDILEEDDLEHLEAMRERVQPNLPAEVEVKTLAIQALPHDFIPRYAEEIDAGLIVMGTKGASAAPKIFFGSTTARVIRQTERPVIAVPLEAPETLQRIGIAFEKNTRPNDDALELLRRLATAHDAELVALHVGDAPSAIECRRVVQDFQERLGEGEVHLKRIEPQHTFEEDLATIVRELDVDLLCMVRGHHSALGDLLGGSATLRQAFDSPVPLLVLHC
ncbi:MAG: universal stress protein [Acidobacteriota bacterium]